MRQLFSQALTLKLLKLLFGEAFLLADGNPVTNFNVDFAVDNTTNNINIIGNAGGNEIWGNAGNNIIDSLGGKDTLHGGAGDDTYIIHNANAKAVGGGTDTVVSDVSVTNVDNFANVENFILTGTVDIDAKGNDLDNHITGNSGKNALDGGAGNDVLDGGAGDDQLTGGLGNDTYYVDSIHDVIVENANGGTDTVISSVAFDLSANVNIENLTYTGTANLDGTGNALSNLMIGNAGINHLNGGEGNDTLNGGANADVLTGGNGNDTYYVDNAGDQVIESSATGGTDTVMTSVSYTLSANVENITAIGSVGLTLTGNALNNTLLGNSGANKLDGGAGSDTLTGGAGNDSFIFKTAVKKGNVPDHITDLAKGDQVDLSHSIFKHVGSGSEAHPKHVASEFFHFGKSAATANQHLISDGHTLWYDADGVGGQKQIAVAVFDHKITEKVLAADLYLI